MITGFNTDVDYDGRTFHVQTEDKGQANPVIESLVYTGGEIVTTRRASYAELLRGGAVPEAEVQKRMESQHQALIREIVSGRFDPEGPKPFGYNLITNRSLDDVILDFLSREVGLEQIRLEIVGQPALQEGMTIDLRLRVIAEASDRPVAGAKIVVKLITTRDKPRELFSGATGADGTVDATLVIPETAGANAAVLVQADAAGNSAELKQLVLKSGAPS
jgi:hypothetical protein